MHISKNSPPACLFSHTVILLAKRVFLIAPIVAILALTACSKSSATPSTGGAEASLREEVESASKNQIKLASFTKTDGQKIEIAGVTGYKLTFTAKLQFQSDGTWQSTDSFDSRGVIFKFSPGQRQRGTMNDFENTLVGGKDVRQGEQATITGIMEGVKSENGWKWTRGQTQ